MPQNKRDLVWTIFGIFLLTAVFYLLLKHTEFISGLLIKSGPVAPLVALMMYSLFAATPIPTDPITIVVGVIYGPLLGILIAGVGNVLAAIVEYYVGYRFGNIVDFESRKRNMPLGLDKMPISSPVFLIFGRMIPGYGSKVISLVAGADKVAIKRYLWTSILTSFLGACLIAYGGFGLFKLIK